jgi:phage terminase small subunit
MRKPNAPTAPRGLCSQALRVWKHVVTTYDLEPHDLENLARACVALTVSIRAEEALLREGVTVENRFGERRPHPADEVARLNRAQYEKLLRAMNLEPLPTPARSR